MPQPLSLRRDKALPDASTAGPDGLVAPPLLRSAVDCRSIGPLIYAATPEMPEQAVGERLALRPVSPVRTGEPCGVTGWAVGGDQRFRVVGAAVHSADGRLGAVARHTIAAADGGVPRDPDVWGLGLPRHPKA